MKTKVRPQHVKGDRHHRFDCKVNEKLFRRANAARMKTDLTWPQIIEASFERVINSVKEDEKCK